MACAATVNGEGVDIRTVIDKDSDPECMHDL